MTRRWRRERRRSGPDGRAARRFLAFAVVTTLLTVFMANRIVGADFGSSLRLQATFDDVNGLRTGNRVKVAGTQVGRVSSVKVVDGRAVVSLAVRSSLRIPVDSSAVIRWRDLIGEREVSLEPGTSPVMAKSGQALSRTRSAADLGALINNLGPLLGGIDPDSVNKILQSFAVSVDGNQNKINQITTNLAALLQMLGSRTDTIKQMIGDYKTVTETLAARDKQIGQTIDNLTDLTQAFAQNRDALGTAAVRLGDVSANLDKALGGSARDLGTLVASTADLTEVAHNKMKVINQMVKDMPAALQALLAVTDGGNYVRGNALCMNIVHEDTCPFPMNLPPPPAVPSGGNAPAISPAAARLTTDQQKVFQAIVGMVFLGSGIGGKR
jgi:phospholipid/cholesterol/gamma-HCH transport system substrate-binding protein